MRISDWSSACALPIYNILWGDSFGGLFALHVLFNHPAAYQTYLVGSPSINWSGGAILEDEINLAAQDAAGEVAARVLFNLGAPEEKLADHVPKISAEGRGGKEGAVRVDFGECRIIKKQKQKTTKKRQSSK